MLRNLLIEATKAGAAEVVRFFNSDFKISNKEGMNNLVTEADHAAEKAIIEKIKSVIMPAWTEAARLAEELKLMEVNAAAKQKAAALQEYIRLRIEETSIIEKQLSTPETDYSDERAVIVEKLNKAVDALGKY